MCMAKKTMIADMPTKTAVMVLREIRSIRHRKPDERGDIVTSLNESTVNKFETSQLKAGCCRTFAAGC